MEIIIVGLILVIGIIVAKKITASKANSSPTQSAPVSRAQPAAVQELSAAQLARKAIDALAAVGDSPEHVRELWRAGRFEPLNLALQAVKMDRDDDLCHEAVMKTSTYLVRTMHKLSDFDSADEICTQAQRAAKPDEAFYTFLMATFSKFEELVGTLAGSGLDDIQPLTGEQADAARLSLAERVFVRAETSRSGTMAVGSVPMGYMTNAEAGIRYEWAARLNPLNGRAWYWAAAHTYLNTRNSLDGESDYPWALKGLRGARICAERAAKLMPENESLGKMMQDIEALIAKCS